MTLGNIPDTETVSKALKQIEKLGLQASEIVSDNGYCTGASIAVYLERKQSFLMRIEADTKWISPLIDRQREELEHGGCILSCDPKFSGCKETVRHTFQRQTTKGGEKIVNSITETVNIFLYFSSVNKAKDDVYFRESYNQYKEDLLLHRYLGKDKKRVESFSKKYMIIHRDDNGNITEILPNIQECKKRLKYSGYLVLVKMLKRLLNNFEKESILRRTSKIIKVTQVDESPEYGLMTLWKGRCSFTLYR